MFARRGHPGQRHGACLLGDGLEGEGATRDSRRVCLVGDVRQGLVSGRRQIDVVDSGVVPAAAAVDDDDVVADEEHLENAD